MARPGQTLENPVTGERLRFRETAAETDGRALRFDYALEPGGFAVGRFDHVHPRQEERFEVVDGRLGVRIDGDEWTATAGTRFAVLPETAHTVWNDGDDEMRASVEIRPALDLERFFEITYALAREGKTDERGIPTPLRAAVIADEFAEEIRLAGVPAPLQRAAVAAIAPFGRARGYRVTA